MSDDNNEVKPAVSLTDLFAAYEDVDAEFNELKARMEEHKTKMSDCVKAIHAELAKINPDPKRNKKVQYKGKSLTIVLRGDLMFFRGWGANDETVFEVK